MLSIFPDLLSYQQISPMIIRLTLGIIFVIWSYKALKGGSLDIKLKIITSVEGISGILLIIGLWTQLAALFIVIDMVIRLYFKFKERSLFSDGINYYFILLIMAISLMFTGAGFISIDLPL